MAVNASILAVPGLGTQLAMKALCSISFILCVYSIIGCAIAQQLVQSLRYLDFSVRSSSFFLFAAWSDNIDWIGILLTRGDGHFCDPCEYTDVHIPDEVK
jgi:hypothetical protein